MERPLKTNESGYSIGQLDGHGLFAGGSKNLEKEEVRESEPRIFWMPVMGRGGLVLQMMES